MDIIGMIQAGFKAFSDFVGLTNLVAKWFTKSTDQKITDTNNSIDSEEQNFENTLKDEQGKSK